jgi:hypothetical protein
LEEARRGRQGELAELPAAEEARQGDLVRSELSERIVVDPAWGGAATAEAQRDRFECRVVLLRREGVRLQHVPAVRPIDDVLFGLRGQLVLEDDGELLREAARSEHAEYESSFARVTRREVAKVETVHDREQAERRAIEVE